jgi:murein DD-endopeptidase MepM/ murein hydrolase activator NlpD
MDPRAPSITQQFRVTSTTVAAGGPSSFHKGIDINAAIGTPVLAAAPGRVVKAHTEPAYGSQIFVDHGTDGTGKQTITIYRHLSRRLVSVGETVARGQQIGAMGNTGFLAGGIPHLHFEVHRDKGTPRPIPVDPHTMWVNGSGRVSCYDAGADYSDTVLRITYPVPCRGG